jgi:GWxTD domain-containing protein
VKFSKYFLSVALLLAFSLSAVPELWAQRNIDYRQLAMRDQQSPLFFDFIVLPGEQGSEVTFTSVFSLSYNFLPLKKNNSSSRGQFFSSTSLSLEVFKSNESQLQKKPENTTVRGLELAGRSYWSDTAYAETYEQSQSKEKFLKGNISVNLQPGIYNFVLQMKRGEESDNRVSRVRATRIEPYDKMKVGNIILGENLSENGATPQFSLVSMGDNVPYGQDFHALAYLPQYEAGANYTLRVNSIKVDDKDTTKASEIYSQKLSQDDIRTGIIPKMAKSNKSGNYLNLASSDNGFAYALVKIPNSTFPNALYRLTITRDGSKQPVSQTVFRSIWLDMPRSLLNLDVAINMLHYIVDKETLNRLSKGSQSEKEKKFREFWKKRDPTPKTEYNELMAEYYRRVDYAYENFTTQNVIGYESDQGEVYIKFGPPQNIERKYPTNGATTEIWTYPSRQFVFRATTGFGDFKLVSNSN